MRESGENVSGKQPYTLQTFLLVAVLSTMTDII
jgi:hypothetical protein